MEHEHCHVEEYDHNHECCHEEEHNHDHECCHEEEHHHEHECSHEEEHHHKHEYSHEEAHNHDHTHCHEGHHHHEHQGKLYHLESGNFEVTRYAHEDASVVSAKGTVYGNEKKTGDAIRDMLKNMAVQIEEKGGLIGHMKAAQESHLVKMYSITDSSREPDTIEKEETKIDIQMDLIICLLDEETVEAILLEGLGKLRI